MMLARSLATKHEIKAMELRVKYRATDYRLAELDGRLKVVAPHKPETKPSQTPTEKVKRLLAKMNDAGKEEVLRDLLK